MEINNILVIQTGGIAEVMFSTPALSALRKRFPEAHISFLLHPERRALLEQNPDTDQVLLSDAEIKEQKYDLSLNLQGHFHFDLLTYLAKIKRRFSEKKRTPYDYFEHEIERHLRLLRPLEIKEVNPQLKIKTNSLSDASIKDLFDDLGIDPQKKLLGLHIGGSKESKPQTAKIYAKVTEELIAKHNLGVLLLGSKNELPLAQKILSLTALKPHNLVNKLSLSELISIIKRLDLYIGAESGPLQIAAAFSVPVTALFSSRLVKPIQRAPWGSRHVILFDKARSEDIINSVNFLLSGGGLKRPQDNKRDWLKKSLNILLAFSRKDRDEAAEGQRIFEELLCEGFKIETLDDKLQTVKDILDNMGEYDINLTHKLSSKSADYRLTLAQLLAWVRLPAPILSLNSQGRKLYGANDILDYYSEELNKTNE